MRWAACLRADEGGDQQRVEDLQPRAQIPRAALHRVLERTASGQVEERTSEVIAFSRLRFNDRSSPCGPMRPKVDRCIRGGGITLVIAGHVSLRG